MQVKSAKRVIDIFDLLAAEEKSLSINEISEKLNIPQSSTSGIIQTLVGLNALKVDNENSGFLLGNKVINWAEKVKLDRKDLLRLISNPWLEKIRDQINETAFLAVPEGAAICYVEKKESFQSIRTTATIGGKKPLYCTGLGKAILAFSPVDVQEVLFRQIKIEKFTENTVSSIEELKNQLLKFKKAGYSVDDEESDLGVLCFAVPILDSKGNAMAAISFAGPKRRIYEKKKQAIIILKEVSLSISKEFQHATERN